MPSKLRIGMLTPSLNRALEPITYAMLRDTPEVTAHFSRLRVTHVGLSQSSHDQFTNAAFLQAASLLKDAGADVILWNGTSGSWMGLDWERQLCKAIEGETGIPTSGSTLAFFDAFKRYGVKRFSLAVPYARDHTEKIIEVYTNEGLKCVAYDYMERLDSGNLADLTESCLRAQLDRVARSDSDAIAVVCTNVPATWYVDDIESRLQIPIFDSIAVTLWKAFEMKGIEPDISGWGMLMRGEVPAARR